MELTKGQKISKALKGRQASWINGPNREEVCKKISLAKTGVKNPGCSLKMKGRKFTEEHKEKLRQSKLKKPTKYWLGRKRPDIGKILSIFNKGKKLSEETKRKIGIASTGRKPSLETRKKMSESSKGEKSYWWKGGISKTNKLIRAGLDFSIWRESVFLRDNWTCQVCLQRGGELHPHHIKSFAYYPELRFDINNGVTLCKSCHKLTDNYANKKRTQEEINKKIKEYEK
jgi:5-methylcytosine-specific restriction endonuclease McrA